MTTVDIILITIGSTASALCLSLVVFMLFRRMAKFVQSVVATIKRLIEVVDRATAVMSLVQGELAYMRQVTQAVQGQQVQEAGPPPPVGHVGEMPPAFPKRAWETYPDAATEDTDHSLLTQTDEEVMQAQHREEMRVKGIDVDDDDKPQAAVVEEA